MAALALLAPEASAFWRLPCIKSNLVVERVDPIVDTGKVGSHVHAIQGGNSESLLCCGEVLVCFFGKIRICPNTTCQL